MTYEEAIEAERTGTRRKSNANNTSKISKAQ